MKAFRFVVLALTFVLSVLTTKAQTPVRYTFGTNPITTSDGKVWSPIPSADMVGFSHYASCPVGVTFPGGPLYNQQVAANPILTVNVTKLPAAQYTVNLYFASCPNDIAGQRVFSYTLNGVARGGNFDIVTEAGGATKPDTKSAVTPAGATSVTVAITSHGTAGNPSVIIAAIEILPATVVAPPVITTQPQNLSVTVGQTASFAVAATGTGLSYQWQRNGVNIGGATLASYTSPSTTQADANSVYNAVVSNSAGSVTTSNAVLGVTAITGHLDNGLTTVVTWNPADLALSGCGNALTCTTSFSSPSGTSSGVLSITIGTLTAPLSITTTSLPAGTVGVAYSAQLAATGGKAPYTWTVSAGLLPDGLAMTTAGLISGAPTTASATPVSFTITVKDSSGLMVKKKFGGKR